MRRSSWAVVVAMLGGCGGPAFESAPEGDSPIVDSSPAVTNDQASNSNALDRVEAGDAGITLADAAAPVDDSTPTKDAGMVDASTLPKDGGKVDAAVRDAAMPVIDAGQACPATTCPSVKIACVPESMPQGHGWSISSQSSVAWRFQVLPGRTLKTKSVSVSVGSPVSPGVGSMVAAIMPLVGPTALPINPLATDDVVGYTVFVATSSAPIIYTLSLSATLVPGWYALIIGTEQLGATGATGYASVVGDANVCQNGQQPLSVPLGGTAHVLGTTPYFLVDAE